MKNYKRELIIVTLISIIFFGLLIKYKSYNYSFDSVAFMIEHNFTYNQGSIYFEHFHHPLKDILGGIFLSILRKFGIYGRLIDIYQTIIGLIASINIVLFYFLLKKQNIKFINIFTSIIILICSSSYLYFSGQYEVYIPAITIQILFYRVLLQKNILFIILTGILLPLSHQTQLIILGGVFISGLITKDKTQKYAGISILIYFIIIFFLYYFYVPEHLRNRILFGNIYNSRESFFNPYYFFSSEKFNGIISLGELIICISKYKFIFGIGVLIYIITALTLYKDKLLNISLKLNILFYLVFLFLWDSGRSQIWILIVPSLIIILSNILNKKIINYILITIFILIGIINFYCQVIPDNNQANNKSLQIVKDISRKVSYNDAVVIPGLDEIYNDGKVYIPYFAARNLVILKWAIEDKNWKQNILQFQYLYIPLKFYNNLDYYCKEIEQKKGLKEGEILNLFKKFKFEKKLNCSGFILIKGIIIGRIINKNEK